MPFYGNQKFDPTLIWCQIFVLQSTFYLSEGVILGGFYLLFGSHLSLDEILNWKRVSFSNTGGWLVAFSLLASSIVNAFLLVVVVERAKKCLDFSFTLFFVHFLLSWAYSVSKDAPRNHLFHVLTISLFATGFAYGLGMVGGHDRLLYRDVYSWGTTVHAGRNERY